MVAVEIDPRKVELAAHNAKVYGVEDRIEFVVGDFFRLAPFLKVCLLSSAGRIQFEKLWEFVKALMTSIEALSL